MFGLLKKDMMLIIKSFSPVYLIAILPPIVVSFNNPYYFLFMISISVALLIAMQVPVTMESDEKVHWEKIVMSMPISTKAVAISKYVLTFMMAVFAGIVVAVLSVMDTKKIAGMYVIMAMILVVMYNAIVIPVSYKFGTGKSKYFVIFFVTVPVLVSYLFKKFHINVNEYLWKLDAKTIYTLLFCTGTLLILISIMVSVRVLDKRG